MLFSLKTTDLIELITEYLQIVQDNITCLLPPSLPQVLFFPSESVATLSEAFCYVFRGIHMQDFLQVLISDAILCKLMLNLEEAAL